MKVLQDISICIVLICLLNGCSTCSKITFIRATPLNISKVNINRDFYQGNEYSTRIKIADKVNIHLIECSKKLCMRIEPSVGTMVRFDSRDVLVTPVMGGETKNYKMSHISYSWFCSINEGEEKFCSLSDASPTGKPTIKILSDTNVFNNNVRTDYTSYFDTQEGFVGQTAYTQSFFGRKATADGYLVFGITLIEDLTLSTSVKNIKLPKIWVDDIQYEIPGYKLETVTEDICSDPTYGSSIRR